MGTHQSRASSFRCVRQESAAHQSYANYHEYVGPDSKCDPGHMKEEKVNSLINYMHSVGVFFKSSFKYSWGFLFVWFFLLFSHD